METLPNVRFKAVILKDMVIPQMSKYKNLEVICNVEREMFYEILNDAAICCIPLNAMIPCGVSVMQCAILMNVPIVSTDTPSMRTIVPNDEFGFLLPKGDYMGMSQRIEQLLNNNLLYKSVVTRANENMKNFSPEIVANQLCNVIDNIGNNLKI